MANKSMMSWVLAAVVLWGGYAWLVEAEKGFRNARVWRCFPISREKFWCEEARQ